MEIATAILIFTVPLVFLLKYKNDFIYFYLVFNIIIDMLVGFIDDEGQLVALSRGAISLIFILVIFYNSKGKLYYNNKIFMIFFYYLLLLIPFSSNLFVSISSYIKIIITFTMFPIGLFLFDSLEKLKKLNLSIIYIMMFIVINFFVSNYFKVGVNPYGDSVEFYTGNLKISALYSAIWVLLVSASIHAINNKSDFRWAIFFSIPTLIFVIISFNRITIFTLGLGALILVIFSKEKIKKIKWIAMSLSVLLILSPLYLDILEKQFDLRKDRLESNSIYREGRYLETIYVMHKIFNGGSTVVSLFGTEVFNSISNYGPWIFGKRPLHVDWNIILHGSGLLGLILYLGILFTLFKKIRIYHRSKRMYYKSVRLDRIKDVLIPVYYALLIGLITVSFSGGLMAITQRTIVFLYLGAIIGVLNKISNEEIYNSKR